MPNVQALNGRAVSYKWLFGAFLGFLLPMVGAAVAIGAHGERIKTNGAQIAANTAAIERMAVKVDAIYMAVVQGVFPDGEAPSLLGTK